MLYCIFQLCSSCRTDAVCLTVLLSCAVHVGLMLCAVLYFTVLSSCAVHVGLSVRVPGAVQEARDVGWLHLGPLHGPGENPVCKLHLVNSFLPEVAFFSFFFFFTLAHQQACMCL